MDRTKYVVTVPPAYTGVVFVFCWTYLTFYATSAGIEAAAPISLYSTSYSTSAAAMIITLVVLAFAPIDRIAFLTDFRTKLITGIGLALGTTLLITSGNSTNLAVIVVAGIATGVLSGIMLMQWVMCYRRVGLRVAVGSFPLLMAMSVAICATLMYLPHEVVVGSAIVFPVISEVLYHEVRKEPWPEFEDEQADIKDRPINFVLLLLPIAVYGLASGFLDYSSGYNNYTYLFYAFGALVPLAVSGIYMFMVERDSFVSAFLAPAGVIVAVCIPFLTLVNVTPLAQFISIGELGIEVLVFIAIIGFAHFFTLDALKTYALGRASYVLFNAIGWYIGELANRAFSGLANSQFSLMFIFVGVEVLTVCLIIAIVKAQKSIPADSKIAFDEQASEQNLVVEQAPIQPENKAAEEAVSVARMTTPSDALTVSQEDRVDAFCHEYGLSQRERDVFELLAKGYTSPRIQQELYIAAGTVNYHCRNIYAKLGVHSKQELITLFESSE
ncbi:MAG: helix-turn-helix transcriptional regulator [Eggerthellaceae bacterium]|nr:helix-turn-helix transcriptional regulator [Eggerthellaceae bacterium]